MITLYVVVELDSDRIVWTTAHKENIPDQYLNGDLYRIKLLKESA